MKKIFFAVLIFGSGGIFAQSNNASHKEEQVNTTILPGVKTTDHSHDAVYTHTGDMKLKPVTDRSHDGSQAQPVATNQQPSANVQRTSPSPYKAPTGPEAGKNNLKRPVQPVHNGPTPSIVAKDPGTAPMLERPIQPVHNGPTPYKEPTGKEAKTK